MCEYVCLWLRTLNLRFTLLTSFKSVVNWGTLPTPFWCLCQTLSLSPLHFNKTLLHKSSERSILVSGPGLNSSLEAKNPGVFAWFSNTESFTPLNYILKNWDRFDPQGLKKTHLVFLCDTTAWPRYPLEDGEWWPVGGSLKYNTVLQLDQFCKKKKKKTRKMGRSCICVALFCSAEYARVRS